jgi:hypothetical protein
LGKKLSCLVEIFNFVKPLPCLLHPLDGLLGASHVFHRTLLGPSDSGVFGSLRRPLVVNYGFERAMVSVLLEFVVNGVFIRGLLDLLQVLAELIKVDALVSSVRHDVLGPQLHLLLFLVIHGGRIRGERGHAASMALGGWTSREVLLGMGASEFPDLRTESAVANFLNLHKLFGCLRPLGVLCWLLKPLEV